MYDPRDTIVAVASAAGSAARGIVRISGEHARQGLDGCFTPKPPAACEARGARAMGGALQLDGVHRPVPADLLWWPGTRSYTREPLGELHLIGSPPLLEATVRTLCRHGARVAEPGEFTLRAFLSGRLDLTQAEAVQGVIEAGDRRDLDAALTQLAGGLRQPLTRLRDDLLDLLAHLEAGLDFVDEQIEFISAAELTGHLSRAAAEVARLAEQLSVRSVATGTLRVVLAGSPNVGKSSLFNALSAGGETPRALVSPIPGTTRDWLSARLTLNGLPCEIIDTAGAESYSDGLSSAAQTARAAQRIQAHLTLLCLDSTRPLSSADRAEIDASSDDARQIVLTKCDGPPLTDYCGPALRTSATTGAGLSELKATIVASLRANSALEAGAVAATSVRCAESLRLAGESLSRAQQIVLARAGEELAAAEIRTALSELGRVVGAVYTDDLLDRIFSRFCIGK